MMETDDDLETAKARADKYRLDYIRAARKLQVVEARLERAKLVTAGIVHAAGGIVTVPRKSFDIVTGLHSTKDRSTDNVTYIAIIDGEPYADA